MKKETLISILVFVFIIIVVYVLAYYLYFTFPTKIEVERYFEENKCVYCSGEAYGEVYQMRRQTAMLWGQIFRILGGGGLQILIKTIHLNNNHK